MQAWRNKDKTNVNNNLDSEAGIKEKFEIILELEFFYI